MAHPDEFTWTSIVPGHFVDARCLDFLHVSVAEKRIDVLDDGETRASATTLARVGDATARILANPEVGRNRIVYIQSFCVSQNEFVAAFERATGNAKWTVNRLDSKDFRKERKAKADAGDATAREDLVWLLGALQANWEREDGFVNKALGYEDEDLDSVVQQMVKDHGK